MSIRESLNAAERSFIIGKSCHVRNEDHKIDRQGEVVDIQGEWVGVLQFDFIMGEESYVEYFHISKISIYKNDEEMRFYSDKESNKQK